MSVVLNINGLAFDFDDRWVALKWDDHPAWRKSKLSGYERTKAIDILALHDDDHLWLIEAGDVRGEERRITHKNAQRDRDEPIHVEFASKVRDTVAASVWAQGRIPEAADIVRYLKRAWRGEAGKVHVVLWLEGVDEAIAMPLEGEVGKRLAWLNPKVRVTNSNLSARHPKAGIDGLTVRTVGRSA